LGVAAILPILFGSLEFSGPPPRAVSAQQTHEGESTSPIHDGPAFPRILHVARIVQPRGEDTIAVTVTRLRDDSSSWVSGGIPLPKGMIFSADVRPVTIVVNESEIPAYTRIIASQLHDDGSIRSILVQFRFPVEVRRPVTGLLIIGRTPRARLAVPAPIDRGDPSAVVLPSDPSFLVSTGIVGATMTSIETIKRGGWYARYDRDFARFADIHWRAEGDNWQANYYDRALAYYAWWARTGNAEYWRRGTAMVRAYRDGYLVPNKYGASPHWSLLDGVATHYLVTGDSSSLVAVGGTTKALVQGFTVNYPLASWEPRIWARVLDALLLSYKVNAPGSPSEKGWRGPLDKALGDVLAIQRADGSFNTWPDSCTARQLLYQSAMLGHTFARLHAELAPDKRLPTATLRLANYLWVTGWDPVRRAFRYSAKDCEFGGRAVATDLYGLFVTTFGFAGAATGDSASVARSRLVFQELVRSGFPSGSKQFNQEFSTSYRYLGLLH
jgi:hypothetical protein